MAGGKHSSYEDFDFEGNSFKKIGIVFLVLVFIAGICFGGYKGVQWIKENKKSEEVIAEGNEEDPIKMIEKIEGYNVLGQIVIQDLKLEQYILDSVEEEALKNGVGKLYGGYLNENGNFCIAGHNYENVFQKLEELEIGDTFYVLDTNFNKTHYEIKEIYSVEPDDLECLLQNEELVEMTLITCKEGATTRLVVRAIETEEIENNEETVENDSNLSNTVKDSEENV